MLQSFLIVTLQSRHSFHSSNKGTKTPRDQGESVSQLSYVCFQCLCFAQLYRYLLTQLFPVLIQLFPEGW